MTPDDDILGSPELDAQLTQLVQSVRASRDALQADEQRIADLTATLVAQVGMDGAGSDDVPLPPHLQPQPAGSRRWWLPALGAALLALLIILLLVTRDDASGPRGDEVRSERDVPAISTTDAANGDEQPAPDRTAEEDDDAAPTRGGDDRRVTPPPSGGQGGGTRGGGTGDRGASSAPPASGEDVTPTDDAAPAPDPGPSAEPEPDPGPAPTPDPTPPPVCNPATGAGCPAPNPSLTNPTVCTPVAGGPVCPQ